MDTLSEGQLLASPKATQLSGAESPARPRDLAWGYDLRFSPEGEACLAQRPLFRGLWDLRLGASGASEWSRELAQQPHSCLHSVP